MAKKKKKAKKKQSQHGENESVSSHKKPLALRDFQAGIENALSNVSNFISRKDLIDGVFTLQGLLSDAECASIISLSEQLGFSLTEQRESKFMARRRNGRIALQSAKLAFLLWKRCSSMFHTINGNRPVGLNPNFRFYKYEKFDSFGLHVDDTIKVGSGHTYFTLLIYLNTENGKDLQGGATNFYRGKNVKRAKLVLSFAPCRGVALVHEHFPSCMLHEGEEVRHGTKYLMRTDVVYES